MQEGEFLDPKAKAPPIGTKVWDFECDPDNPEGEPGVWDPWPTVLEVTESDTDGTHLVRLSNNDEPVWVGFATNWQVV